MNLSPKATIHISEVSSLNLFRCAFIKIILSVLSYFFLAVLRKFIVVELLYPFGYIVRY